MEVGEDDVVNAVGFQAGKEASVHRCLGEKEALDGGLRGPQSVVEELCVEVNLLQELLLGKEGGVGMVGCRIEGMNEAVLVGTGQLLEGAREHVSYLVEELVGDVHCNRCAEGRG